MTSPLSGGTLTAQRAKKRWKKYYLAVSHPGVVFTARINQTFAGLDGVNQLTYDGGVGTYANVKPGMTCWIGSEAGLFDIGMVRVRKLLTANSVFIGRQSGIPFENDQYLTFVQDFQVWGCEPFATDARIWMDDTIEWSADRAYAPIVKLGPIAVVLEMTGSSIVYEPDVLTYSPTEADITKYLWTAPGASATASMTTSAPAITYNAPGEYYVSCTIIDETGANTTAYRKVFVNPSSPMIETKGPTGDIDSGCWSVRVEGYSGVQLADLHDRALCVLWKKDFVGTARDTSYGPYARAENVRLVGWIDGDSLSFNSEFGTATFTIQGPAFWLNKIPGSPMTIKDDPTPANWNEMYQLTVDKALYRLVRWQSTLASITDITFTGETTRVKQIIVNSDSLLRQFNSVANEKLLASLQFDRFGCGRFYIAQSLQNSTQKEALTVLFDILPADIEGNVGIERTPTDNSAMIEIGGSSWDGTKERFLYSRAPGNSLDHYGDPQGPYSALAFSDQTICNRISGDLVAQENSEFPTIDVELHWANDFIDISPAYIVRASLLSLQTPRGIAWTDKRLVPQAISYIYNSRSGAEHTAITFAEETTGLPGVTYYPPSQGSLPYRMSPEPSHLPFPPSNWFPPIIFDPPVTDGCGTYAEENSFELIWEKTSLVGYESILKTYTYFPCKLRPADAFFGNSYLLLPIRYQGDARGKVHCYGVNAAKTRIITGVVTAPAGDDNWSRTRVDFLPVDEVDVIGFELVLEAAGAYNFEYLEDAYFSGSFDLQYPPYTGAYIDFVPPGWYSVFGRLGPWYKVAPTGTPNYCIGLNGTGKVGLDVDSGIFYNDIPAGAVEAHRIGSSNYGEFLFYFDGTPFYVSAAEAGPGQAGTLGWAINGILLTPREIDLGYMSRVFNVCTAG